MGVAGFLVLVAALLAASTLVVSNDYPTTQTAEMSFNLPDDFSKVRSILMRTEATKQIIILAGDNEFLDERWDNLTPSLNLTRILNPQLNLELKASLKVRSRDDYIERPVVTLKQVVKITSEEVLSDIRLDEGSDRLWQYELITHYTRNEEENNTRVDLRLTQEILTTAPWFAHWIADNQVYASAERQLVNQKRAIRQLIEENRDKGGLLPIPQKQ